MHCAVRQNKQTRQTAAANDNNKRKINLIPVVCNRFGCQQNTYGHWPHAYCFVYAQKHITTLKSLATETMTKRIREKSTTAVVSGMSVIHDVWML